MKLHFKTGLKRCPECKSKLVICKTYRRTVKSSGYGIFDAVVHTKKCHVHGLFGPEQLSNIVSPHCTYANDIMVDAGIDRFIKGYSCSEISMQLGNGISERHVRNISNMAGEIIMQIHDENVTKLKDAMNSYILQIDGTTDSEFAMVIVVRDAISGFTLYAEKCHSESFESVKDILVKVKKKFGIPSGAISDMRAGILEALEHVFPGIPVRICLMHFLRDLGKDLLSDIHTDLGIMINKIGIKSPLKSLLRSIPAYNQATLYEIEQGFCTDRKGMEAMSVRKILESILSVNGSSGYGFPFSLSHLNFYLSCRVDWLYAGIDLSNDFNGDFIPILLIIMPRSVCISLRRSFPRSRRKCIKHILMGISGNTCSSASNIHARISDIAPEGIPNFSFAFTSIFFMFSNDSEWHFSAYSVKPDIASLTTMTMANSESVLPPGHMT